MRGGKVRIGIPPVLLPSCLTLGEGSLGSERRFLIGCVGRLEIDLTGLEKRITVPVIVQRSGRPRGSSVTSTVLARAVFYFFIYFF